jgi:hypothetical protein
MISKDSSPPRPDVRQVPDAQRIVALDEDLAQFLVKLPKELLRPP